MTAPQLHKVPRRARSIAVYGGSFDPVHVGHLAVARAAQRRFHLEEVHFVPAGRHPFKTKQHAAPFAHRHAMLALACAEHPHFVPSLADAGEDFTGQHVQYSVDTVRHFRRQLHHPQDQLYFITGVDSFLEIPTWREYETLLGLCDFIVVSRPGFKMNALRLVIPPELLARPTAAGQPKDRHTIALRKTCVHLLDNVVSHVSSTEIRRRRHRGQSIHGLVPVRVEEYILRQALYT
jgi:nicotinate-nucleotide adenylyltransferase